MQYKFGAFNMPGLSLLFLVTLPNISSSQNHGGFIDDSHLTGVREYLIAVLICISLMIRVSKDVEKQKPSCTVSENSDRYSHRVKQYGISSKN